MTRASEKGRNPRQLGLTIFDTAPSIRRARVRMVNGACFLGIDVARTSLGLVLVAAGGDTLATRHRAYTASGDAATDPQDWWRAARTGIKEILRRCGKSATAIRCIGVTG